VSLKIQGVLEGSTSHQLTSIKKQWYNSSCGIVYCRVINKFIFLLYLATDSRNYGEFDFE